MRIKWLAGGSLAACGVATLVLRAHAHERIAHAVSRPQEHRNALPEGVSRALKHHDTIPAIAVITGNSSHKLDQSSFALTCLPSRSPSLRDVGTAAAQCWFNGINQPSFINRIALSIADTQNAALQGLRRLRDTEESTSPVLLRMADVSNGNVDANLCRLPVPAVIDCSYCDVAPVERAATNTDASVVFLSSPSDERSYSGDSDEAAHQVFVEEVSNDGINAPWIAWYVANRLDMEIPDVTLGSQETALRSLSQSNSREALKSTSELASDGIVSLESIATLICRGVLRPKPSGDGGDLILSPSSTSSIADGIKDEHVVLEEGISMSRVRQEHPTRSRRMDALNHLLLSHVELLRLNDAENQLDEDALSLEGFIDGLIKRRNDRDVKRKDFLNAVLQAKSRLDALIGRFNALKRRRDDLLEEEAVARREIYNAQE